MKIVPYSELEDKTSLYTLFAKSFDWYCTPKWLEDWANTDFRLQKTPIGFCAIVRNEVASFIGTMEIPTRNKHGEEEIVGGIWLVATLPTANRQGLGRKLLEFCESYFRRKGYHFCTLTTSRNIVAFRWYRETGYEIVKYTDSYPHYYKVPHLARKPLPQKPQGKSASFDYEKTLDLFDRYMTDRCGFVFRDIGSLRAREQFGFYDSTRSVVLDDGYLLANSQSGSIRISEVIALKTSTARSLLKAAVGMSRAGVYARFVFDATVAHLLEKQGFRNSPGTYDVLMAKPLSRMKFDQVYDRSFICSRIDFF